MHRLAQHKILEQAQGQKPELGDLLLGETLRLLPERREVYRARSEALGIDCVVKRYLPHAKQDRDWRREWEGLLNLQASGLPAPLPLCVSEDEGGAVCVVMQYLDAARPLGEFLDRSDRTAAGPVLSQLAQLVGKVHAAGARQGDQHIDNWAVADGTVYLLDAGTFHFKEEALSLSERLQDLAAICATLQPAAEDSFRRALGEEYWIEGKEQRNSIIGSQLDEAIIATQLERIRRYDRKTRRKCTEFGTHSRGIWQGLYASNASVSLTETFFKDPDALMHSGERLKSGNTCTVQSFEREGQSYVLKRYNKKPFWTRLKRSFQRSRASRSWSNGWVLRLSFIPTAKPVAFADEAGLIRNRSYLLTEAIPGQLLPDYVESIQDDPDRLSALVEEVGRIWDRLGRIHAVHRDLKATNWMVTPSGEVYLIDLDALSFGLSSGTFRKGRKKDLSRFLKNWEEQPELKTLFYERMKEVDRA